MPLIQHSSSIFKYIVDIWQLTFYLKCCIVPNYLLQSLKLISKVEAGITLAKGFNVSMRPKPPVPIWLLLYTLYITEMGVLVGILLIAFVSYGNLCILPSIFVLASSAILDFKRVSSWSFIRPNLTLFSSSIKIWSTLCFIISVNSAIWKNHQHWKTLSMLL